jgi:tetratricopeptide (TPR) repeat protein
LALNNHRALNPQHLRPTPFKTRAVWVCHSIVENVPFFASLLPRCKIAWAAVLVFAILVHTTPGRAQQAANVSLEANEQLFAVLAALNAAGYDTGLGMDTGNPVRQEVRGILAKKNIPVLGDLKKFYEEHRIAEDSGANLGQYISLALLLDSPPNFALTVPQSDLPPDANRVVGFVPLLRKFYEQANLLAVWSSVRQQYEAEINRYSTPVRRSVELTDAYLRLPSGAYLGRKYFISLSLLGGPEQVHARIYGLNYYLVATPSRETKIDEIRHQYLHFLLDPMAAKYSAEVHRKESLLQVARGAPRLAQDFKDDFSLLLTECLIRATELRMDKAPKSVAEAKVKELTEEGLILTPYFYTALAEYEQQEASMNVYYRGMIEAMDPNQVEAGLSAVKFSTAPPPPTGQTAAQPALTELERLLDQGDNSIYENHYEAAQSAFQSVLDKFDPHNERALFGLAIVASNTRKPDAAEEYFHKVLESARDVRLATWSHIYLGRINDLKGDRKQALAQYRAASLTAAAYPDALRAVQSGLAVPYGAH